MSVVLTQVERERSLYNSKCAEFDSLLRNPYVPKSSSTQTNFLAGASNPPPMGIQNNTPAQTSSTPLFSSFSQLGASANLGSSVRQELLELGFNFHLALLWICNSLILWFSLLWSLVTLFIFRPPASGVPTNPLFGQTNLPLNNSQNSGRTQMMFGNPGAIKNECFSFFKYNMNSVWLLTLLFVKVTDFLLLYILYLWNIKYVFLKIYSSQLLNLLYFFLFPSGNLSGCLRLYILLVIYFCYLIINTVSFSEDLFKPTA